MQFESGTTKKFKVKLDYTIWDNDREIWLNNIKVPAKLRNKGIGTNCMREFTAFCDTVGYDCKLLYLKESQIHWYEQFGFKPTDKSSELCRKPNIIKHKDISKPSNIIEGTGLMFEEL